MKPGQSISRIAARLAIVIIPALSVFQAAPSQAQGVNVKQFIDSMAGSWRARGTVRESANDAAKAVLCKFSTVLKANKTVIQNSGRCAVAQGDRAVSGALRYNPGSKRFSGNMLNAKDGIRTSGSGTLSGNKLTMRSTVRDTDGKLIGQGSIVVERMSARKFRIHSIVRELASGRRFKAMAITMTKR